MNLFNEVIIGKIKSKNHFIRSATWENLATETGHLTPPLSQVYENLAKGAVGIIITGYANILADEKPNAGMMGIYEDSFIDEYKVLTDNIHKHGSKVVLQVAYGGTKTTYNIGERIIFAPSSIKEPSTGTLGKEMTKEEIKLVVEAFGESARRAKASGFDGIEIHSAHTYLINQFLSPNLNKRTDEYGGNLENRSRFLIEIYEAMREKVGLEFPIWVKITATDFMDDGLKFNDVIEVCKKLEEIGVDAIELSGNIHGKAKGMTGEVFDNFAIQKEGYFIEYAKELAKYVQLPIITVGGFSNLETINHVANSTSIKFFAISRPLLAEPNLISRWQNGNVEKAKCVRCSKCRTPNGNYCVVFK
ncbi:MAG: oxidoreductase [Epulopiscium sp. Nele67-Bin005]|nr:MAG: oxidoreductase [Epulopiscium sp. Nele67-Bin005]